MHTSPNYAHVINLFLLLITWLEVVVILVTLVHMSTCANCGTPASLRCSKCKILTYCGRQCQKAHWPAHKALCRESKLMLYTICDRIHTEKIQGAQLIQLVRNTECPICLDDLSGKSVRLTCVNHAVCQECFDRQPLDACPLCRTAGVHSQFVIHLYADVDELRALVTDVRVDLRSAKAAFDQVDFDLKHVSARNDRPTWLSVPLIQCSIQGVQKLLQDEDAPWWVVWRIREFQAVLNDPTLTFPGYKAFRQIMLRHRLTLLHVVRRKLPSNFQWHEFELKMR